LADRRFNASWRNAEDLSVDCLAPMRALEARLHVKRIADKDDRCWEQLYSGADYSFFILMSILGKVLRTSFHFSRTISHSINLTGASGALIIGRMISLPQSHSHS
jgi:hypothetical protein